MQRRHFEFIAEALNDAKPSAGDPAEDFGWRFTVATMATHLARTNPNFNRERFLKAAGAE